MWSLAESPVIIEEVILDHQDHWPVNPDTGTNPAKVSELSSQQPPETGAINTQCCVSWRLMVFCYCVTPSPLRSICQDRTKCTKILLGRHLGEKIEKEQHQQSCQRVMKVWPQVKERGEQVGCKHPSLSYSQEKSANYWGTSRRSQQSEASQAFQEQVGLRIPLYSAIGWSTCGMHGLGIHLAVGFRAHQLANQINKSAGFFSSCLPWLHSFIGQDLSDRGRETTDLQNSSS